MRVLIDTHVFLWLQTSPPRVGSALAMLQDEGTEILLSAASSWEISIKWSLGKLPLPDSPERWVPDRMQRSAIHPLPITHGHALGVTLLPAHHNDPFDRILIAQAIAENVPVVTADSQFAQYDIELINTR